jgi:hypothetical protein
MSGECLGTPVEVRRRPRALLQTAADDDPVVEGLFPHEYVLRPGAEAHAGEWDVVVSETEVVEEFEGLLVVGLGAMSVTGLAAAKAKGRLPGRRSALPRPVQDRLLTCRADGMSLRRIAAQLTTDQVPTASGRNVWVAVHGPVGPAVCDAGTRVPVNSRAVGARAFNAA